MESQPIHERLRALRLKAGLDPEAIAAQIGLSAAWYEDLERDGEELEAGLDISQLGKLAVILGVGMGYLVTGAALPGDVAPLPFQEVARQARGYLEHAPDLDSLETKTGWDLGAFLKHPAAEGWEQRLPFFRDVCRELGLDWRGILKYCESQAAAAEG